MSIDNIAIESEFEREALDMIDTTSKQVESLANNSEFPNGSEWENGDECIYKCNGAIVVGWHPYHPVIVIDSDVVGLVGCSVDELSKPESPEQKAERERDEAIKIIQRDMEFSGSDYYAAKRLYEKGCHKEKL